MIMDRFHYWEMDGKLIIKRLRPCCLLSSDQSGLIGGWQLCSGHAKAQELPPY